jgi:hypothetical protein
MKTLPLFLQKKRKGDEVSVCNPIDHRCVALFYCLAVRSKKVCPII